MLFIEAFVESSALLASLLRAIYRNDSRGFGVIPDGLNYSSGMIRVVWFAEV